MVPEGQCEGTGRTGGARRPAGTPPAVCVQLMPQLPQPRQAGTSPGPSPEPLSGAPPLTLASAFSLMAQVLSRTTSALSGAAAWPYPACRSTAATTSESFTFIWLQGAGETERRVEGRGGEDTTRGAPEGGGVCSGQKGGNSLVYAMPLTAAAAPLLTIHMFQQTPCAAANLPGLAGRAAPHRRRWRRRRRPLQQQSARAPCDRRCPAARNRPAYVRLQARLVVHCSLRRSGCGCRWRPRPHRSPVHP